jgi:D-3-phosphoglycerate dehydrogenase / 2-oxoglutarate reductase
MDQSVKRVFYVRHLPHATYSEIMGRRADVIVERVENNTDEAIAGPIVSQAHAFQIVSTRDELLPKYMADTDLLSRAPNLLIVSTSGAGFDTVNPKACTKAGVLVVNQVGGNREAVAEHVLGMMLSLSKRIPQVDRAMRRDAQVDRIHFMGNDMFGRTIGIVGLGNVGSRVAQLCAGLFSMRVLAYDPYLRAEQIAARGAEKVELDELMSRADVVSINCPLSEETRGMIGARQYALMQRHAIFITTARGHIHDEAALVEALREKRIAGAGLDVWAKEPPTRDHPLLQFDNVIASPHTAGVTHEARANMGRIAAQQLLDTLDGRRPPRIVNPEVWPHYAERFERAFGFAPAGEEIAAK